MPWGGGKKKVAKTLNNWYKHILSLLDKIIWIYG
jgi:hypothetical protein